MSSRPLRAQGRDWIWGMSCALTSLRADVANTQHDLLEVDFHFISLHLASFYFHFN